MPLTIGLLCDASHELQHGLQVRKFYGPLDCFMIYASHVLQHGLQLRFDDVT
jgi:hypothetical protein